MQGVSSRAQTHPEQVSEAANQAAERVRTTPPDRLLPLHDNVHELWSTLRQRPQVVTAHNRRLAPPQQRGQQRSGFGA